MIGDTYRRGKKEEGKQRRDYKKKLLEKHWAVPSIEKENGANHSQLWRKVLTGYLKFAFAQ